MQSSDLSARELTRAALAGAVAMASAMGFGRFSFTPILPGMMGDLGLGAADAGTIAAGNFAGYLAGALLAGFGWAAGRERRLALAGLLATALLQFAMAAASSVVLFTLIRFAAGLASAFAMVFTSSIVLSLAARRGSENAQSLHFGGVGVGIGASSLVVALLAAFASDDAARWRYDWCAGGAVSLAALAVVSWLLPRPADHGGPRPAAEPPLVWTLPLALTTLSYGIFGFGYVVTATFVVAMARMGAAGPFVEFLTWFLAGITAALSIFAWRPAMIRVGLGTAFLAAMVIEAAGVLASAMLPGAAAPLIGGLLLGATFMVVTAYGLRIGRLLSPQSPRRILSFMTVAFGIGQIIGPLVAGRVAEQSGGFAAPSVMAAAVLALAALIMLPVLRRLP